MTPTSEPIGTTTAAEPHRGGGRPVVVLGGTGAQGGAVARALRRAGWRVRALVRDPSSGRGDALAAAGVELVPGDLGDSASLRAAFAEAYGVFSVQPSSGQAGSGVSDEQEVAFGLAVADAASSAGVSHLVYSSANAVGSEPTGVGHFDSKRRVERHLATVPIATTVLRPAAFMEILMLPGTGLDRGEMSFLMRPDAPMQFIAVDDIGRVAAAVFDGGDRYAGRTLELAGDELTGDGLARILTRATGRPVTYRRFPAELLDGNPLLDALARLVDDGRLAGGADLRYLEAEFGPFLRFGQWLDGPGAPALRAASAEGASRGGPSLR
ncbi:NmrA/HSCARG family protein [Pseudonocardia sp. DR1-2]|uniref:NmrA/HSCARG family protein n=1 Tax=Pseudonocardia sp. DR1-2 TaxID=2951168 RepID=UPI002042C9B7|nr:NmrA/HSCARG family protein [Pseudonocardia sp. DR1-2]MCM3849667.1 NmrA/HSCARG family protein [Pseudonocardia sp. DR1-2]